MDYNNLINLKDTQSSEIDVTWTAYDTLPLPSEDNYMTIGVVNREGSDYVYLCIMGDFEYKWYLLCRAGGQLAPPIIQGVFNSILSWGVVDDAVSYDVYINGNIIANVAAPSTTFDLAAAGIIKPGTYRIQLMAKAAPGSEFTDSPLSTVFEYRITESYYKFVDERELTSIPTFAQSASLPETFKTQGVTVNYKTVGEQYEYFAYPASYEELKDVVQSGQHVLGNYTKLDNTILDGTEYRLYRTTLRQIYDDSDYRYCTFKIL